MPTFALPRFVEDSQRRVEHARKMERVVRESGGDVRELRLTHTAVDAHALRGLPCVARSVAGVVSGTQPEAALMAKQR